MPRRPFPTVLAALGVATAAVVVTGVIRLKDYVDNDPRLCAQCHRASPEFALWNKGSHRSVACQRCHHSTPEQGLAMLRAFLAGKSPVGSKSHAAVEVGSCAACHLSHDPHWPQVGGSRGHRIHVEQQKIACVTCHAAGVHGFEPVSESCRGCHGQHAVGEPGMQKLHCFACHDFLSTGPGLRPTRRDCLRCHQAEGVLPGRFPDDAPMQFPCGACHKPHARSAEEKRLACAVCHRQTQRAGLHALAGHRTCKTCHQAHVWRAAQADCLRCHAGATSHAKEMSCWSCHGFRGGEKPLRPKGM